MGDIVERLRIQGAVMDRAHGDTMLCQEAANAIEALREENERLREQNKALHAELDRLADVADEDASIHLSPEQLLKLQTEVNNGRAAMLRALSGDKQDGKE